ncbi:5'-3' exoribonuclease 2-like [Selaginella moellendorffii]|uniref:5'-3' exoribonuclease 2-like n=1 Tax=Selaginella moellendorffii TaxID=88036 RepID=UPI000D1CFDD0|nr:5'-3' exoribonuclease 2-like [Selaginella moellendorffii]|eukprot:XP_024537913.1 5'-3' exoribonuclease 2-like [Selaginella moellendorffii]
MGIPLFFGWLCRAFPAAVGASSGQCHDNLYLDMNSIVHSCFHPSGSDGRPLPTTQDEVFQGIGAYIDAVVELVRPRKLLFLAVDGVAPRAKMNQQRARRFVAAREAADATAAEEKLRGRFAAEGRALPPPGRGSGLEDSNVITPGTKFMADLSAALREYVNLRLATSASWKGLQVILSDSSVPGEGEHKIMSFIRGKRKNHSGEYDPETSHCVFGADADLILLTLATHEQNFSILRESREWTSQRQENVATGFEFLDLSLLRECLVQRMRVAECPPFEIDDERVIDDFVFMCCLIGNDFLPHIPTLLIDDGAIDSMITIYTTEFTQMGDYLTRNGEMNLPSVAHFFSAIAASEEGFLKNKYKKKERRKRPRRTRRRREFAGAPSRVDQEDYVVEVPEELWDLENGEDVALELDDLELEQSEEPQPSSPENHELDEQHRTLELLKLKVRTQLTKNQDRELNLQLKMDRSDLGSPGWKTRYYSLKLEVAESESAKVVLKYLEGLAWILRYYYHGVSSWRWYYPYYYAPFASDFSERISGFVFHPTLGEPLKPLEQLLAVLPPQSSTALPACYQKLMLDPASLIADFYPGAFEVDYTGSKKAWKGVVKLPFVDEARLTAATKELQKLLSEEEMRRNRFSSDLVLALNTNSSSSSSR